MYTDLFFIITAFVFSSLAGIFLGFIRFQRVKITDFLDVLTMIVMVAYTTCMTIWYFISDKNMIVAYIVMTVVGFVSGYIYGCALAKAVNNRIEQYCHLKRSELVGGERVGSVSVNLDDIFGGEEE